MNLVEHHILIEEEQIVLSNLRSMFWPRQKALVISDLHIGKTAHFRKHGIQISSEVQRNDLNRLSYLIDNYKPETLIIVGDLFHAEENSDMLMFTDWVNAHKHINLVLIKGNHDRMNTSLYKKLNIKVYEDQLDMSPFYFIHEPQKGDLFTISGHLHPGYLVKSKGSKSIKLPCFQRTDRQLILPAFSSFTGLAISENQSDYKYYAFTEHAFYEFN